MKNADFNYTTISDLIKVLEKAREEHGDIPICIDSASPLFLELKEYFYDGGYYVQDSRDPHNYVASKEWAQNGIIKKEGIPPFCLNIRNSLPKENPLTTLNGRSIREIDPDSWEYLEKIEVEERKTFRGQLVQYKWDKIRDEVSKCYLVTSFVDSGESARGTNMRGAKEELKKLFESK